jgi:hypothetical protein
MSKMEILDLGALRVAFSVALILILIFCSKNPGRRCIFAETAKIRPKNGILRILALDDF